MPWRERLCVYAAPNVTGPAVCHGRDGGAAVWNATQTSRQRPPPFSQNEIPLFLRGHSMSCTQCHGRGGRSWPLEQLQQSLPRANARQTTRLAYRRLARLCAILCCAKNPCSGKKNSLFSEEQGIGCKLLNRLGDRLPKRPKAARKRATFPDIPCSQGICRPGDSSTAGAGQVAVA